MTHASLFSGIGGPEVAAAMLGWTNAFHCDINPFGRAVLEYWFPNSKSYGDIKKTDFTEWGGAIDVLTGGFPCQPFSYAGERRGADDDRYLWPEFKRVIAEIRPTWVVGENVAGITTMVEPGETTPMAIQATLFDEGDGVRGYRYEQPFTIERVCSDLEGLGYSVQPILIPACAVGAPHRRDRVFIIARDVAANANLGANGGVAGEDEGKGGEERIQERHEVRKPDEPNQVRREGADDVTSDTIGSREGTSRPSASVEGCGGKGHLQSSEWQSASERDCGLHELLRHSADSQSKPSDELRPKQSEDSREEQVKPRRKSCQDGCERITADTDLQRLNQPVIATESSREERFNSEKGNQSGIAGCGRWESFPSVSPILRGNDGLPFDVDCLTLSFGKWRTEALKAYGNAIVPQVMYEIFRAIEMVENEKNITNALTL